MSEENLTQSTPIIIDAHFGNEGEPTTRMQITRTSTNGYFSTWEYVNGETLQKVLLWSFQDIIAGNTYAFTPLALPSVLAGKFPKDKSEKYMYRGLCICEPEGTFLDEPGGDHGRHGCSWRIHRSIQTEGFKSGDPKFPGYFEFNLNYYVPMILPNWQILFHITENYFKDWGEFNDDLQWISVDDKIEYDVTLGIFYTRGVSFVDKPKK